MSATMIVNELKCLTVWPVPLDLILLILDYCLLRHIYQANNHHLTTTIINYDKLQSMMGVNSSSLRGYRRSQRPMLTVEPEERKRVGCLPCRA